MRFIFSKAVAILAAALILAAAAPAAYATDNEGVSKAAAVDSEQLLYQQSMERVAPLYTLPILPQSTEHIGLPVGVGEGAAEQVCSSLPSSYDMRTEGRDTSVKHQGTTTLCWAFSTISSAESVILSRGYESQPDLSELQLGFFCYNRPADPLDIITDDRVTLSSGSFLDAGGNMFIASNALASGVGFANESLAVLSDYLEQPFELSDSLAFSSESYSLENCYWVEADDVSAIKTMLLEHGSCAATFCFIPEHFNYGTSAHYNSDTLTGFNHAVTVVGWDDGFDRNQFGGIAAGYQCPVCGHIAAQCDCDCCAQYTDDPLPEADGAWLVKNSWGTEWGDEGYFWVSYSDTSFTQARNASMGVVYCFDVEPADVTADIYQYDGGYSNSWLVVDGGECQLAAVYTAKRDCLLNKISFTTAQADVEYCVKVCLDEGGDMQSGEQCLAHEMTGRMDNAGFHTIELPDPIELLEGERYSVVVGLKRAGELYVPTDVDSDWGWVRFDTVNSSGECFVKTGATGWQDASEVYDCSLRIKGRTTAATEALSRLAIKFAGTASGIPAMITISSANSGENSSHELMYSSADGGGVLWFSLPQEDYTLTVTKPGHRTYTTNNADESISLVAGDINDDGYINALDSGLMTEAISEQSGERSCDVNGDSMVGENDRQFIIENYGK